MRSVVLAVCLLLPGLAWAEGRAAALLEAMQAERVVAVMVREGLEYGSALDRDMLAGDGGEWFRAEVKRINAPSRLMAALEDGLDAGMSDSQMAAALTFFESPLGQRIAALEASGREAFLDEAVKDAAEAAYGVAKTEGSERFHAVRRYVEVNELVDLNVRGELASTYHFFRGMVEGQALEMSEADIMRQVSAQTEEIGESAESWIFSYLIMAYGPLELSELQRYTDFSASADGQALNRALFAGFGKVFDQISYDLGRAIAQAMRASDL